MSGLIGMWKHAARAGRALIEDLVRLQMLAWCSSHQRGTRRRLTLSWSENVPGAAGWRWEMARWSRRPLVGQLPAGKEAPGLVMAALWTARLMRSLAQLRNCLG